MNTTTTPQSSGAIRTLAKTLGIGKALLVFLTVLVVAWLAIALTGRGSMSLAADLDEPYTIEFSDGRRVGIAGTNTIYENFEIGRESESLADVTNVGVTIAVSRDDTDTRTVIGLMVAGWLAATWVGLLSLEKVVTSARNGRAFADENPARLRRVGAAIIAVPAITFIGRVVLNRTLDTDIPISLSFGGGGSVTMVIVLGLGVFALAAVFAEAARLREFEESTI